MKRAWPSLSLEDYADAVERFSFGGVQYVVPGMSGMTELTALQGELNPVVAAAINIRASVFSEIRFSYQSYTAGRPDRLFGTPALSILEKPWPSASTRDLLAMMEVDASLYGNSYWIEQAGQLVRLDPTKIRVVTGAVHDSVSGRPVAPTLVAYAVLDDNGHDIAMYGPDQVVHYAPLKTANSMFRGRAWLSSVLPDVSVDRNLTTFKKQFVANGAMPGMVITYPPGVSQDQLVSVKEAIERNHSGASNAFKTLHLGGGADPKVVGAGFDRLEMKSVQGGLETRIAAASGVPATVLGISEGLQGSQLNAGNYVAARRRFADGTIRPLWRAVCSALEVVAAPPDRVSRLWYDDRDVPFLQEDVRDEAEIRGRNAGSLRQLIEAGFEPASAVDAVITGDFSKLDHTGNVSVQLQPPGLGVTDE